MTCYIPRSSRWSGAIRSATCFLLLASWLVEPTVAQARNVTVDEQDVSIVYEGRWGRTREYDTMSAGGFHMSSDDPNARATFKFNGTAVYLWYSRWPYLVASWAQIDDEMPTRLDLQDRSVPARDGGRATIAATAMAVATDLDPTVEHTLTISTKPNSGFVVMDMITYTAVDEETIPAGTAGLSEAEANAHRTRTIIIAVAVVVGILLVIGIPVGIFFWRSRRRMAKYGEKQYMIDDLSSDLRSQTLQTRQSSLSLYNPFSSVSTPTTLSHYQASPATSVRNLQACDLGQGIRYVPSDLSMSRHRSPQHPGYCPHPTSNLMQCQTPLTSLSIIPSPPPSVVTTPTRHHNFPATPPIIQEKYRQGGPLIITNSTIPSSEYHSYNTRVSQPPPAYPGLSTRDPIDHLRSDSPPLPPLPKDVSGPSAFRQEKPSRLASGHAQQGSDASATLEGATLVDASAPIHRGSMFKAPLEVLAPPRG